MTEFSIKRLQETLHKQNAGFEKGPEYHRSHVRYRTFARVKFRGQVGKENLLKNISVLGCCVECTSLADIRVDSQYTLEVIPEAASGIGYFDLEVKAVWVQATGYSGDVGFTIIASPKGKLFQRYVDYLSWRDAKQRKDEGVPPEKKP
ncbi:MAG: PilZ domain-containing protein [Treponema sp.]|jgi:hypothetical protein|nr:PilZ domain-containing protein [Treponema sp.]